MLVTAPATSRLPMVKRIKGRTILVIVIVILACVAAFAILQASSSGEASIAISFLSKTGSCSLTFSVTNRDGKILHGWTASMKVSPAESNITVTPTVAQVISLGPQGSYNGTFTVTLGVVPPGRYSLQASLVNGTTTIATSNTLSCVEPST